MVFLPHFFIFMKLLFLSCVSVNDGDKTRSGLQVIAAGEAYHCCIVSYVEILKLKVENTFLIRKNIQIFKVNKFVFLV